MLECVDGQTLALSSSTFEAGLRPAEPAVSTDAKMVHQNALKAVAVAFPGLLHGLDCPSVNAL